MYQEAGSGIGAAGTNKEALLYTSTNHYSKRRRMRRALGLNGSAA